MFPVAQVPDIPQTLFLGPDSRMPPEMGEGQLSQRRSAAHSLTDHILCLLCPASCCLGSFLHSLPLHAFALDTHLPHRHLFSSPFMHMHACAHRWWVQRKQAVEGERRRTHVILPPSLKLCSPVTGLLSVCTTGLGAERERERFLGHQAVICPGKHRAHQKQNLTDCFYCISCHKTHFLGGYTPASPPLSFCSPLPEEGHLRSSHKFYCPGLPPAGPGPLRLSRGNRNPGW